MSDMFPRMLYKAGGSEAIHGGKFATLIVGNETELDNALVEGWHMTTPDALAATVPEVADTAAPTRAELEAKCSELGIKFDGRMSDKTLGEKIDAALKAA
jgi:hypothetical protein